MNMKLLSVCFSPPIPHTGNYSASRAEIALMHLGRRNLIRHAVHRFYFHLHTQRTTVNHSPITVQWQWLRSDVGTGPVWSEESIFIYRLYEQSPFISCSVFLLCLHSLSEMQPSPSVCCCYLPTKDSMSHRCCTVWRSPLDCSSG